MTMETTDIALCRAGLPPISLTKVLYVITESSGTRLPSSIDSAKLPTTSVNTTSAFTSTAGSITGTSTRHLVTSGEVPRLRPASSSDPSKPRSAASTPR